MQKFSVRELKGAPLSIVIVMMLAGKGSVSVSYLVNETGYTDKTLTKGLDFLRDRQIITQTGRTRYQLTGQNVQLPLSWGETIEPADPSPAFEQPSLFTLTAVTEKFSGKKLQSGNFPETGISPDLENRVSALEKRVSELEKRNFSGMETGNSPEIVEIFTEKGEISDNDIKSSSLLNPDMDNCSNEDDAGKIPEISREEYIQLFNELDDFYGKTDHFGCKVFPGYCCVNAAENPDFLDEVEKMQPEKSMIEFFVPRVSSFSGLKKWLAMDYQTAKKELLTFYGISSKMLADIMRDRSITLEEIDYQYQYWKQNQNKPGFEKWSLGTVCVRIRDKFDCRTARTSDPLAINCLDEETAE